MRPIDWILLAFPAAIVVAAALKARFDAPEGVIEADVSKALAELRKIGALDE